MSQIKHIFKNIFSLILVSLSVACALTGCRDEVLYRPVEIPDAMVDVEAEVIFRPLIKTEIETRAVDAPEGAAYKNISSLIVFFFDKNGTRVNEYTGEITNVTHIPDESTTQQRVKFKKRVQAGEYYVFAVANISDEQKTAMLAVTSIEELRKFSLDWNDDISKDLEMFGVFRLEGADDVPESVTNSGFEADELIVITPTQNKIHSWVRRAVSKITVDFDGSGLKDNVTVYIKNAVLKDLPKKALLGEDSKVDAKEDLVQSQYALTYGSGESFSSWTYVSKINPQATPPAAWNGKAFHDDAAMALPCYENMQGVHGEKSKYQDSDGDGIIDSKDKDGVELGTYLEVEGYYVSNRPEYKSQGKIIYRFMLGQNAENDFNLTRNHHYKITMKFKDYGSDIDWHIVYAERFLDATYPEDVNYQGKFFTPDHDYSNISNAGHAFDGNNVITLTSFESDGKSVSWIEPSSITYTYYNLNADTDQWVVDNSLNENNGWLDCTPGELNDKKTQKDYTFVASMAEPTNKKVNELFPSTALGSESSPYNLSSSDGTMTVETTANSYMVGAPGWYCFPLVYGNAYTDGKVNSDAYASSHFVNHLGNQIDAPYIKDNAGIDLSDVCVRIIWQDAEDMVVPKDVKYDASLFEGKGGIKFHISSIKEGNAVIALIDNKASEDEFVNINRYDHFNNDDVYGTGGSTKAVWSWHIWTTRFGFQFEKDIKILTHDESQVEVMPANLGWCAGDSPIRYYPRRKCDITFKVGDSEIVRTIIQYPYFALPRGGHPYYQWGRKDPFVAAKTNAASDGTNKDRWTYDASGNLAASYLEWSQYNPPRLYNEPHRLNEDGKVIEDYREDKRKHSKDCLEVLVKNPDKWHNAPRRPVTGDEPGPNIPFKSLNESYSDLWSLSGKKTVYDPCPPGYQVGEADVFSGFTVAGINSTYPVNWYDVMEDNILKDYYNASTINTEVLEFYTDTRKLQSISFPVTGYRDYDARAGVIDYAKISFVWSSRANDATNSTHLKIQRHDQVNGWRDRGANDWNIVGPWFSFYNTDGFAVRPVKIKK